jgi:hypothetical protein
MVKEVHLCANHFLLVGLDSTQLESVFPLVCNYTIMIIDTYVPDVSIKLLSYLEYHKNSDLDSHVHVF